MEQERRERLAKSGAESLGITWDDAKNYTVALVKWVKDGRPVRSQELVEHIYIKYCKPCEENVNGRCKQCGCRVNLGIALFNKIRMATEDCPLDKWPGSIVEPVDVVYTLSSESRHDDIELRYSLRSLQKYAKNLGRIFVVGHKPHWLTGVTNIPHVGGHACKDADIINKLRLACESGISERFIFASDDQCLLAPTDLATMPATFSAVARTPNKNKWEKRLHATAGYVASKGVTPENFDTHTFQPHSRIEFLAAVKDAPYDTKQGLTVNTLALNLSPSVFRASLNGDKTTLYKAVKNADALRKMLAGRRHLGYNDNAMTAAFMLVLGELFPEPSQYELPENRPVTTAESDLVLRIYMAGSDDLRTFGGLYQGAYYLQQSPEEAAEFITLAKRHLSHPRLLEVGSAAGGFAKLLDDEVVCRSVRIIDDNKHPQAHWRPFRLPHVAGEYVGMAEHSGPWLAEQNELYDLMIVDTDHRYETERKNVTTVLPYLAPGGLLVFHDAVACTGPGQVGQLLDELRGGSEPNLEYLTTIGTRLGLAVFRKRGEPEGLPPYQYPPATLLYHFAPWLPRQEMIDFHLQRLPRYLHQFSKVRMNIVTGDGFAPAEEIEERLRPFVPADTKFFRTPNTADGEVTPFFNLLLPEVEADERVCYGHSKAAMLQRQPLGKAWAELMYTHVMQNSRAAIEVLKTKASFGTLLGQKCGRCKWHYSGTFFWFRGDIRDRRGWDRHERNRYGVERWLGGFLPMSETWSTLDPATLHILFKKNVGGVLARYCNLLTSPSSDRL
jgi:hypothetical protein